MQGSDATLEDSLQGCNPQNPYREGPLELATGPAIAKPRGSRIRLEMGLQVRQGQCEQQKIDADLQQKQKENQESNVI